MTIIRDDEEIEIVVQAEFHPGHDAVWYLSNGDPGYPAEPDEIDDIRVVGEDIELTEDELEKAEELLLVAGANMDNDRDCD